MSYELSEEEHGGSPARAQEPLPDPSPPFALEQQEYAVLAEEYFLQKRQMLLAAGLRPTKKLVKDSLTASETSLTERKSDGPPVSRDVADREPHLRYKRSPSKQVKLQMTLMYDVLGQKQPIDIAEIERTQQLKEQTMKMETKKKAKPAAPKPSLLNTMPMTSSHCHGETVKLTAQLQSTETSNPGSKGESARLIASKGPSAHSQPSEQMDGIVATTHSSSANLQPNHLQLQPINNARAGASHTKKVLAPPEPTSSEYEKGLFVKLREINGFERESVSLSQNNQRSIRTTQKLMRKQGISSHFQFSRGLPNNARDNDLSPEQRSYYEQLMSVRSTGYGRQSVEHYSLGGAQLTYHTTSQMSPPSGGQEFATLLRPNRHLFNHCLPAAPNNDLDAANPIFDSSKHAPIGNVTGLGTVRSSFDRHPFQSHQNSLGNQKSVKFEIEHANQQPEESIAERNSELPDIAKQEKNIVIQDQSRKAVGLYSNNRRSIQSSIQHMSNQDEIISGRSHNSNNIMTFSQTSKMSKGITEILSPRERMIAYQAKKKAKNMMSTHVLNKVNYKQMINNLKSARDSPQTSVASYRSIRLKQGQKLTLQNYGEFQDDYKVLGNKASTPFMREYQTDQFTAVSSAKNHKISNSKYDEIIDGEVISAISNGLPQHLYGGERKLVTAGKAIRPNKM